MIERRSGLFRPSAGAGRTLVILGLLAIAALTSLALPDPATPLHAQEAPHLASLEIGIWPEYDRPAALVILRGELAVDAQPPATMSLRLPVSSGGPSAVASTTAEGEDLITRSYELTDAGDHLLLTFTTPDPLFQVEFYDTLPTDTPDREYTYVWPGQVAVDQLSVRLQEPAGASKLSVEPDLGPGSVEPDGLVYREAQVGAFEIGQPLTLIVRYHKTDPRTSKEILSGTPEPDSNDRIPSWLLPVTIAAVVIAAVGAGAFWRAQRRPVPAAPEPVRRARRRDRSTSRAQGQTSPQSFCTQCGYQLGPDDRYCSRCGARVRGR